MLDCIKEKYEHLLESKCSDNGCRLKDINVNCVILNGDKISSTEKTCDCIIIEDSNKATLIELKGRMQDPEDLKEKFMNSSIHTTKIINKCCPQVPSPEFYHVLITRRTISTIERKQLHSKKIRIDGRNYSIKYKKCGCSFCDIHD